MSKRVIFVGLLCSLVGLIMGREIVFVGFGPQQAHYTHWLRALFFPAGVMLLLGVNASRTLLSVLLGVFYLIWAKALVMGSLFPAGLQEQIGPFRVWGAGALPFLWMAAFLIIPFMMLIHWMLCTRPFDDHLGD